MPSPGELELSKLLATIKPVLSSSTYVWATLPHDTPVPSSLPVQMLFREAEGTTLITTRNAADTEGIDYHFVSRMITLDLNSSLDAVGFLAFITNRLKALGVGINPVSGYHHDHLFVPAGSEEEVINCLQEIAREALQGE